MAGCCGTGALATLGGSADVVRTQVRETYAEAARRVGGAPAGCCGADGCSDPITRDLYGSEETSGIPEGAVALSLGCGNPNALVELASGDVVLDLGSGGGIDVLITARRVGPTGKAYGLDMTDEMLDLARRHQLEAGVTNAEFIKGQIEDIPLPNDTVDVVMSNCVINLSPEKDRVLAEAFRVLRPGGRFAVSDIVFSTDPHPRIRERANLWGACIGGALTEAQYRQMLEQAGFEDVELDVTREYGADLLQAYPDLAGIGSPTGRIGLAAAFIRGRKPV